MAPRAGEVSINACQDCELDPLTENSSSRTHNGSGCFCFLSAKYRHSAQRQLQDLISGTRTQRSHTSPSSHK